MCATIRLHLCWTLLVLAMAILAGCAKSTPTVVLDDWWNEDFAKEGCRLLKDTSSVCEEDQVRLVRIFELELTTQFASQSECSGVNVVRFSGPKQDKVVLDEKFWSLSLNFSGGAAAQPWQMTLFGGGAVTQGEGDPAAIAKSVCHRQRARCNRRRIGDGLLRSHQAPAGRAETANTIASPAERSSSSGAGREKPGAAAGSVWSVPGR